MKVDRKELIDQITSRMYYPESLRYYKKDDIYVAIWHLSKRETSDEVTDRASRLEKIVPNSTVVEMRTYGRSEIPVVIENYVTAIKFRIKEVEK